jgi:hypothetical protein
MRPITKGLVVGAVQLLLVAGIGAKFLYDRGQYPRLWVETAPYDPSMPIRGRYVNIVLLVDADREESPVDSDKAPNMFLARLEARGDRLVAVQDDENGKHWVSSRRCGDRQCWQLSQALAYFIPEHAIDPSRPPGGAALWAEVTLPPMGAPRPIRLGEKKGAVIDLLDH